MITCFDLHLYTNSPQVPTWGWGDSPSFTRTFVRSVHDHRNPLYSYLWRSDSLRRMPRSCGGARPPGIRSSHPEQKETTVTTRKINNPSCISPNHREMMLRFRSKARYHQIKAAELGNSPKGRKHAADAVFFMNMAEDSRAQSDRIQYLTNWGETSEERNVRLAT
jgi:hypothetical protein